MGKVEERKSTKESTIIRERKLSCTQCRLLFVYVCSLHVRGLLDFEIDYNIDVLFCIGRCDIIVVSWEDLIKKFLPVITLFGLLNSVIYEVEQSSD